MSEKIELKRNLVDTDDRDKYILCTDKVCEGLKVVDDLDIALAKVDKLKRLMLLTDPTVSNVTVGNLQVTQWSEFTSEFPDEAC